MLGMEFIAEIRRRHLVNGESVSSIARSLQLSRPTVRKAIKAPAEPVYHRKSQPARMLGGLSAKIGLLALSESSLATLPVGGMDSGNDWFILVSKHSASVRNQYICLASVSRISTKYRKT